MDARMPLDEWVLPRVPYRSLASDLVVAGVVLVLGVAGPVLGLSPPLDPTLLLGFAWMPYVVAALCAATVLLRRRVPVVAVASAAVLLIGQSGLVTGSIDVVTIVTFTDALYAAMLMAGTTSRRAVVGIGAAVVVVMLVLGRPDEPGAFLQLALTCAAIVGLPMQWGLSVRQRDVLVAVERERADAVERAALAEREQAVRAERSSMAAELHDEIAARLSAISLQAGALAARGAHDERQREALSAMRASSAEALAELRSLILVLSDGAAQREVARGIDDVAALEEHAASFGAELRARVALPPGVSTAVSHGLMRIAREGIANAARHAPGAPIELEVHGEDGVTMEIRNRMTGDGAPGTGLGLALMEERWSAVGGTGEAGPDASGDWTVRVHVPRGATS